MFDSTSGVGEDDGLYAHTRKHANGKRDVFGGIALIQMDAALHPGDRNISNLAENKLSRVADRCGLGKVRNFRIGNSSGGGELVRKSTEAGTQDQSDFRP